MQPAPRANEGPLAAALQAIASMMGTAPAAAVPRISINSGVAKRRSAGTSRPLLALGDAPDAAPFGTGNATGTSAAVHDMQQADPAATETPVPQVATSASAVATSEVVPSGGDGEAGERVSLAKFRFS